MAATATVAAPLPLPAWAHAENHRLQQRIEQATAALKDVSSRQADDDARAAAMREAVHQLGLQLRGCRAGGEAQRAEAATEDNLRRMLDQNDAQLREETRHAKKEVASLDSQAISLQADAYRGAERLGQFQLLADWRLEEMEQWVLVSHQKEGDTEALEQYRKQDVAKMRDLTAQLEQRNKQISAAAAQLAELESSQKAAQIELVRATDDLRALQTDRYSVFAQWQNSQEACRRRSEAIGDINVQEAAASGELDAALAVLREEQQSYQEILGANKRLLRDIRELERVLERLRKEYAAAAAALAQAEGDAEVQSSTLGKLRQEIAAGSSANDTTRAANERKRKRLEGARAQLAAVEGRVDAEAQQLGSLAADDARLEAMLQDETKRANLAEAAVTRGRDQQIKAIQQLATLAAREDELQQGIRGGLAARRNAQSRIAELNEQAVRQQELVYNAEYQLAMAEHRVERASGVRSVDETAALVAKLEEARQAVQPAKAEHSDMQAALRSAEAALERSRKLNTEAHATDVRCSEALLKLTCELDSISHNSALIINDKEEKLVAADLLALELSKKQAARAAQQGEASALAGQKEALQHSMAERRLQIQGYLASLQAEQKAVRQALADATMAAQKAQLRRGRLEEKRGVIASTVVPEAGPEKACAELQQQAEELQAVICQVEADLAVVKSALRETLAVNAEKDAELRNNTVTEEDLKIHRLAEDLAEAQRALQEVRAERVRMEHDASRQQTQVDEASASQSRMTASLSELQKTQTQLRKALDTQHERTARAKLQAEKDWLELRSAGFRSANGEDGPQPVDEAEIRYLELQEATRCISQSVAAFAARASTGGGAADAQRCSSGA